MKLCWDNINTIRLSRNNNLVKSGQIIFYKESCGYCGEPYLAYKTRDKGYCSRQCNNKSNQSIYYEFVCEQCDKYIRYIGTKASKAKYKKSRFCSHACVCKNNIGKNVGSKSGTYKHGLSKDKAYRASIQAKRKARKLSQTPPLTENEKEKIALYYQVSDYLGEDWHIDHIIPISKGGLHHPNNLQITTKEYNEAKHNNENFREPTTLEYWRI